MKTGKARIRKRFVTLLKKILAEEFKLHRPKFATKWNTRHSITGSLNSFARSMSAKRVCNRIADAMMQAIAEEILEYGKVELYGVCVLTLGKWNDNPVLHARLCKRTKEQIKLDQD